MSCHLRLDLVYLPPEVRNNNSNDFSLSTKSIFFIRNTASISTHFIQRILHLLWNLLPCCISHFDLLLLNGLSFLHQFLIFHFFFVIKILFKKEKNLVFISIFHSLLKSEHLVADVITNLNCFVLMLEFLSAAVFKDHLALLVGAFILFTPLFMFLNVGEKNQFFTKMTRDL